jgi:hypothetical protein
MAFPSKSRASIKVLIFDIAQEDESEGILEHRIVSVECDGIDEVHAAMAGPPTLQTTESRKAEASETRGLRSSLLPCVARLYS